MLAKPAAAFLISSLITVPVQHFFESNDRPPFGHATHRFGDHDPPSVARIEMDAINSFVASGAGDAGRIGVRGRPAALEHRSWCREIARIPGISTVAEGVCAVGEIRASVRCRPEPRHAWRE